MDRAGFLKRLGLGALIAPAIPKILAKEPEAAVIKTTLSVSNDGYHEEVLWYFGNNWIPPKDMEDIIETYKETGILLYRNEAN